MLDVDTEGKFEYRIKPNIEQGGAFLNRAIEEIQKIIVANKESSEEFLARYENLEKKVEALEAEIAALKTNRVTHHKDGSCCKENEEGK